MRSVTVSIAALLTLSACGKTDEAGRDNGGAETYDDALVQQYRGVLPSRLVLAAPAPEASSRARAVGDPAEYPREVVPMAEGINDVISGMLDGLEAVTNLPPTFYDSSTLELVWGPFDDDDSALAGDKVAVYVREQPNDPDFRYVYALLRGMGRDLSTFEPVIWGAGTPDETYEDHGTGLLVYDFEANHAWEQVHNPDHGQLTRGRFATLFSRGVPEDAESDTDVATWVVAAMRGFVPEDAAPESPPASMDYMWGRIDKSDESFDFLNFVIQADLEGTDTNATERLDILMAFYNEGIGRAHVAVSGGDIDDEHAGYRAEGVECWDSGLGRVYWHHELVDHAGGSESLVFGTTEGAESLCIMQDLDEVPTLDDIDTELRDALGEVATNGVGQ